MNTSKLRIGNIIQSKAGSKEPMQLYYVVSITDTGVVAKQYKFLLSPNYHDVFIPAEFIKPVPVSGRWFAEFHESGGSELMGVSWEMEEFTDNQYAMLEFEGGLKMRSPDHVHTLQNLYLCITGREAIL